MKNQPFFSYLKNPISVGMHLVCYIYDRQFLRSGAPSISRFFRTHVRTCVRAYATSSLRTNISFSVAPRDLIFCTDLVFIVCRYFHKFYQNRPNGYRNRAKNFRRLSRVVTVLTCINYSSLIFSLTEMFNMSYYFIIS